jgi:hypothetical protein|tara:strand:- start:7541 stop:11422 length:3882 start_codon:yes stop_codon:yes gene_type:complete
MSMIKAALLMTLAATLFVLANSASAQTADNSDDQVVASLDKCGLGEATPNFRVLFLLDESGSLETHDRENKRVDGTVRALDALQELANRFTDKGINIEVAIHGFAQDYYDHDNAWSPLALGSDSTLAGLKSDAEEFRTRNKGRWTNYIKAIQGASDVLMNREGCKALVWFTDGEFDTEDGGLTIAEINKIRDELCLAGGPVDQLRENNITVIAIGLSNESATTNPPDMALVEAIAGGNRVSPRNPDLTLEDGRCGTQPGTGDLYETTDPDELIEKFGEILGDSLFETVEVSAPALPCTPEAKICTVEFELGPWVDRFTAYFKVPPKLGAQGLTVALDPPGPETTPVDITYPDGPLSGVPGVVGESPVRSWRMLTGQSAEAEGIWNGVWRLLFEGQGSSEAQANLEFFEGALEVGLDQETLDRANPGTFGDVRLELTVGNQTLRCNDNDYPIRLEFTGKVGDLPPVTATSVFKPGEQCIVPSGFLLGLLSSGPAKDTSRIDFQITPSLQVVADSAVPLLEFPPSSVSLKLENTLVADLAGESNLNRTDPATFESVNLVLETDGQPVGCFANSRYPVILEFNGKSGDPAPVTPPVEFAAGEPCTVPSGFLQDLLAAEAEDGALSIAFDVTPSLVADPGFPPLEFPPSEVSIWLQDALVVELREESRLDRNDSESFDDVSLELFLGNRPFEPPAGGQVTLRFSSDANGRAVTSSATFQSGEAPVIPPKFLRDALLDGPGTDLLRLAIAVTPEVMLNSGGDTEPQPVYEPSTIHVWLHDPLEVRRAGQREIDREDRQSYADLEVRLFVGDQPLADEDARITLRYSFEMAEVTIERSQSHPSGGPYVIPSGFFDDVFDAVAGSDLLLLPVSVTPGVAIGGESHPGFKASTLQFAVRAGEGFPTVLAVTATDFDDQKNSTLTVDVIGPNDGTGMVDIRSISGLPDDLPGSITLVEPNSCEVPNKQRVDCTVDLAASFTANRTIELDVDLVLSGDRTKVSGQTIQDSVPVKPFKMTRPLNPVNFITTLLKLLALFVAVQVLLRALFTTRLARWEGVQVDSRWSTLRVEVDGDGNISAEGGGRLAVDPASTMFAAELESRSSSAEIDGITFEISWMRTFLGEPHGSPFVRRQRAVIRASSTSEHCMAPEGMDLSTDDRLGTGLVGSQFLRSWVLRLPEDSPQALVAGETVLGHLLVIFRPFHEDGASAEDQLDEISDLIAEVAQREIPRLIDHVAPSDAPVHHEDDSLDGTDGVTEDEWSTDQPDPDDPFASTHQTQTTTGSSTEPPAVDDWLSDPDDPLA